MKLKDKTYKKFVDFFEKLAQRVDEDEFEIAYSEIQRETGVASITLKKAIQILEKDGIILVNPGRNTRYGRFQYLLDSNEVSTKASSPALNQIGGDNSEGSSQDDAYSQRLEQQMKNLFNVNEQLRQRVRAQEMAIAVILDRLAEVEDKIPR